MSLVVLGIAVAVAYVCLVVFVLSLLAAAKRGDEALTGPDPGLAAERRFLREQELELTPEDAAFLQQLGRR